VRSPARKWVAGVEPDPDGWGLKMYGGGGGGAVGLVPLALGLVPLGDGDG
jgi:hypothetical protein